MKWNRDQTLWQSIKFQISLWCDPTDDEADHHRNMGQKERHQTEKIHTRCLFKDKFLLCEKRRRVSFNSVPIHFRQTHIRDMEWIQFQEGHMFPTFYCIGLHHRHAISKNHNTLDGLCCVVVSGNINLTSWWRYNYTFISLNSARSLPRRSAWSAGLPGWLMEEGKGKSV